MKQTWTESPSDPFRQDIIMAFISQSTLAIYKQWVADGKKIPLEEIIELAIQLVCHGVDGIKL